MRFINIVGYYPGKLDYMVSEARRLQKESGLNEAALCLSLHPEGLPAIEKPICYKKVFHDYKQALEGSGIKVGILLQSLIGHGWPGAPVSQESWQKTVNIYGKEARWCPLDPGYQDYIFKTISMLAGEKPYSFLVDDDVRLIHGQGLECFCPLHMKRFNALSEREYTSDELREAVKNAEPGDPVLERFEKMRTETLFEFAALIRRAIDSVDPGIPCGYCTPGGEFLITGKMAKILAGKNKPFLRANNATYMEGDAKYLPFRMGYTQALRKINSDIPTVIDESDTFPQHRYSKSACGMHIHITAGILNGLTGAKLWLTNLNTPDPETEKPYDEILGRHAGFYQKLAEIMPAAKLQGAITPIHNWKKFWHPLRPESAFLKTDWQVQILNQVGIPARYEFPSVPGIRMLAGEDAVAFFSDEELTDMLSGPLLLDGSAAKAFCRRGFSREIGVEAETKEFRFNSEEICDTGELLTLNNDFVCPFLTVNGPDTRIVTNLVAFPFRKSTEKTIVAPGTTICRNRLGGTVAVYTAHLGMPMQCCLSPGRKRLLLKVLDILNGAPLPYVAMDEQNIYMIHALLPDGADMLALFNLNFDHLPSLHIRSGKKILSVSELAGDGTWKKLEWKQTENKLEVAAPLPCSCGIVLKLKTEENVKK